MVFGTVSGPIFLFSEFCFSIHFKWNNRKQKNIKYYESMNQVLGRTLHGQGQKPFNSSPHLCQGQNVYIRGR